MQVAAAMPRIARFGPEYEVLVVSGIYREAELVLNIANEALHPLFVAVAVLAGASWQEALPWCCSRVKPVPLRGTTVPESDSSPSQQAKEEPLWSVMLTVMVQDRWPIVVAILLSILTMALVTAAIFLH
jgi:hypothetical protein